MLHLDQLYPIFSAIFKNTIKLIWLKILDKWANSYFTVIFTFMYVLQIHLTDIPVYKLVCI